MKFLTTLAFLSFSFTLFSQDFDLSFPNCNSVFAELNDPLYFPESLWLTWGNSCSHVTADTDSDGDFFESSVLKKYVFSLRKYDGSTWEIVDYGSTVTSNYIGFNGLSSGLYKITVSVRKRSLNHADVYNPDNPCSGFLGQRAHGDSKFGDEDDFNSYESQSFEIDTDMPDPVPGAMLLDWSGNQHNGIVCSDEEGGILLWENTTSGEEEYRIAIFMKNLQGNASVASNSTDWITGELTFEKLIHIWQDGHPNWHFWPGYRYNVRLQVRNRCSRHKWISESYSFISVAPNGNCRTTLEDNLQLSLFPNPTSGELNIEGLQNMETETNYAIHDLSGRELKQGNFMAGDRTLNVEELNNGMYLITLFHERGRSTLRFNVIK